MYYRAKRHLMVRVFLICLLACRGKLEAQTNNATPAGGSDSNAITTLAPASLAPAPPGVAAWWRMEATSHVAIVGAAVKSETNAALTGGIAFSYGAGKVSHARDVPAAFVYDPITMISHTNCSSLLFSDDGVAGACVEVPFTPVFNSREGFTVELFVRIPADQKLDYGGSVPIVAKSRVSDKTASFEIRVGRSGRIHAENWIEGWIAGPEGDGEVLGRNKIGRSTHARDGKTWRHVAIVYDGPAKKVKYYCDYELIGETAVEMKLEPMDRAPLLLGGRPGGRGISGYIDEARYTGRALEPWEFLRASPVVLTNASFKPVENSLLPPRSGAVNVKLQYGAVGDGVTDDTLAIQRAFRECADRESDSYGTIYFPAGVYLLSDSCRWSRFMTIQGDGPDRTTLKLRDNCSGFADRKHPKAVLATGNWTGGEGSASAYANYIFDLAVNIGKGNPGAIGIEFHANNEGGIENTVVRSGDETGLAGINFSRPWPGPSLQRSVRVEGFDIGIRTANREFGLVFEDVTLVGQNYVGLRNEGNSLSIAELHSSNAVPALLNAQAAGFVVLIDSEAHGIGANSCAVVNKGGLFVRNLVTTGCAAAIRNKEQVITGPYVREFVSGEAVTMFSSVPESMNLPVPPKPAIMRDDPREWANVTDFAAKVTGGDWSVAIQAAIDSGKPTIFFPSELRCEIRKPLHVRGNVRRITGLRSGMYGPAKIFAETPMLILDGPSTNAVILDRLVLQTDYGKQALAILHTNKQPLVISRCHISGYAGSPDAGMLFLEDISTGPWAFHRGQKVWARQLNIESRTQEPHIVNAGAQLWILGLRTGSAATVLRNCAGARTEIMGGLVYPDEDVPASCPMFENENSSLSVSIAESCYVRNYELTVADIRGNERQEHTIVDADWSGGRAKICLYTSTTNTSTKADVSIAPQQGGK